MASAYFLNNKMKENLLIEKNGNNDAIYNSSNKTFNNSFFGNVTFVCYGVHTNGEVKSFIDFLKTIYPYAVLAVLVGMLAKEKIDH